jgi:radical SAM protein with 4Fe4S-binding SPASM domain
MSERLYELKLKLTSACDLRCRMCDHWRRPVRRLETGLLLRTLEEAAGLGACSVIFSGGEPTLHPDLLLAVRAASRLGLRSTLASNGAALAPARLEPLLEAGIAQLNVSLDGAVAKIHDRLRGVPGSFERILAGAQRAAAADHPIALKTVVTRENFRGLTELPALADQVPLHSLALTLVTAYEASALPLMLGPGDLIEYYFWVLPKVLEGAAAHGLPVKVFPLFRTLTGLKPLALAQRLRALGPEEVRAELDAFALGRYGAAFAGREPCAIVRGKVLVRPDGRLYPCCEISHAGDLCLGNLREGLTAAWKNPSMARLRQRPPVPLHARCFICTEWFSRPPEALAKLHPEAA